MRIRKIKPMQLNRGGRIIGHLVKAHFKGKTRWAYLTYRDASTYFRKHQGFGINHDILINLYDKWGIDWIIIHYKAVKGDKYLLSNIEDNWFTSDIRVEYSKEFADHMETYSYQVVLPEVRMKEV